MTVGIDGGFVRAAHKEGWFEVIAGKSVVVFRREENDETPSAKCFGFVQTYDEKPRRRLWELLKSQGMQENQQVTFLSGGGDSVRRSRVSSSLERALDRLVPHHDAAHGASAASERVTGRTALVRPRGDETAREREALALARQHRRGTRTLRRPEFKLDLLHAFSPAADKLGKSLGEFETYIRNNIEFIPNFGERYRHGETIRTAFVESTINQVVSKRFVKKRQMQWTPRGAHLLLQTRTKVLNDDLEDVFRDWYPQFHARAA